MGLLGYIDPVDCDLILPYLDKKYAPWDGAGLFSLRPLVVNVLAGPRAKPHAAARRALEKLRDDPETPQFLRDHTSEALARIAAIEKEGK
jgi:hypothetical protein